MNNSYVYIQTERNPDLFTVGFYQPDGKWEHESDYNDSEEAAERVHWFNGGNKKAKESRGQNHGR